MPPRRRLPSMTALMAFEAAARLASFTRAAEELGVTQAAVSRQIHLLEEHFGFPLFIRLHRRIELTERGRLLANASQDAFDSIAATVADISHEAQDNELTISATVAFSHFWLLPRISEFSRKYPEISLRILTQDTMPNVELGEADIAIRFGDGRWVEGQSKALFNDEIFPICSPEFADRIREIENPRDLLRFPLISNITDEPTWTGWSDWFAAFDVEMPKKIPGLRCSFYTEAIYAALGGQGIALGWWHLVEDLLGHGRLVRLGEFSLKTENAYFSVVPKRRRQTEAVRLFQEWLAETLETSALALRPLTSL